MPVGRAPYNLVRARDIVYVKDGEVVRRAVRQRIVSNTDGLSTFTSVIPTLAVEGVQAIDNCQVRRVRRRPAQRAYACNITLGAPLAEGFRGDYSYHIKYKPGNDLPSELRGYSAASPLEESELIVVFDGPLPKVVYSAEWESPNDSAAIDVNTIQLLTIGETIVRDNEKALNVTFPSATRLHRRHVPGHTTIGIRWEW